MEFITKTQFITEERFEEKNGVFVFTLPKECGLCHIYTDFLKTTNTDGFYIVEMEPEEKEWGVKDMLVLGFPTTRVYRLGELVFERKGALFQAQIKLVYKAMEKFGL